MTGKRKSVWQGRILTAVIIAVLATAAGIWSAQLVLDRRQIDTSGLEATRFPAARKIGAFSLVDHNGSVFDNAALKGRWSFLFFGYTHCPDVCPTTLAVLNSVAQQLQDVPDDIRFVFVTVDPERDTPEQLAGFIRYFNSDFIGVTGTPANIEHLTRELGILHMKVDAGEAGAAYLVDHTASVLLFDPDGRYHAVFSPPLTAADISRDFRLMREAYR
ncbi:MAG: SCO family protein [Gammaproteobacteria bacterium]|jgi:protein SCO1/2